MTESETYCVEAEGVWGRSALEEMLSPRSRADVQRWLRFGDSICCPPPRAPRPSPRARRASMAAQKGPNCQRVIRHDGPASAASLSIYKAEAPPGVLRPWRVPFRTPDDLVPLSGTHKRGCAKKKRENGQNSRGGAKLDQCF